MTTITCPCPFCPLQAFNIQTCDVYAELGKKSFGLMIPRELMENRTEEERALIHRCFTDITHWSLQEMQRDKTVAAGYSKAGCSLNVQKLGKMLKICFHTEQ